MLLIGVCIWFICGLINIGIVFKLSFAHCDTIRGKEIILLAIDTLLGPLLLGVLLVAALLNKWDNYQDRKYKIPDWLKTVFRLK